MLTKIILQFDSLPQANHVADEIIAFEPVSTIDVFKTASHSSEVHITLEDGDDAIELAHVIFNALDKYLL